MSIDPIKPDIYGDLFATPDMRGVFAGDLHLQSMFDVEAGLARSKASLGIFPQKCTPVSNVLMLTTVCNVQAVAEHEKISEILDQEAVEGLLDRANYIGCAETVNKQVLARHREGLH